MRAKSGMVVVISLLFLVGIAGAVGVPDTISVTTNKQWIVAGNNDPSTITVTVTNTTFPNNGPVSGVTVNFAVNDSLYGTLIASGMVANAGLTTVVALNATDPTQAALTWQGIEPAIDGLGNANGEILGGLMTLLISLAALRAGEFSKGLNILGLVVGAVGIISLVPVLTGTLGPVFGLGQIIWFVWIGIVLLRSNTGKAV